MQSFDATVVVPTNFVLFTISAIISGEYNKKMLVAIILLVSKSKKIVFWQNLCYDSIFELA